MAYVRVWIHAVWGTKNREPYLTAAPRRMVISHIIENAKKKQICIDTLNGYTDHLHCLFGLNADMTIARTMQLIKGESAHWINKENVTLTTFEWADEYYAVSISEADLSRVRAYIHGQEEHHQTKSYAEEVDGFLKQYGFQRHG